MKFFFFLLFNSSFNQLLTSQTFNSYLTTDLKCFLWQWRRRKNQPEMTIFGLVSGVLLFTFSWISKFKEYIVLISVTWINPFLAGS